MISGLDAADALPDVKVFHAGTTEREGKVVTAGGRVLCVTGLGRNLRAAYERAYEGVTKVNFEGAYFRGDIGRKTLS